MSGVCENVVPGGTKADRIKIGDAFVKSIFSAIVATPSYQAGKTLLVLTFDESNYLSTQDKGNWGIDCSNHAVYVANTQTCQVATILVSARITAGRDVGLLQPLQPRRCHRAELRPATAGPRGIRHPRPDLLT